MEKKRTQAADIAEIASKLDGKVEFSTIVYSQQMLSEKYRETGVNDMYFIGKKFGLWFYTSWAALDSLTAAKKAMKEHNAKGTKTKVYSNGDWEPCGEIVLKGSNKTFMANTRQTKAGY